MLMIGQPGLDRAAGVADRLRSGGIVKICGLRRLDDAVIAATVGADLIGFIFAPARRQVTAQVAREAVAAAREAVAGVGPLAVGVFVDATTDEMNRIADAADLDLLQLHGHELPVSLAGLERPVMKAFRPRNDVSAPQLEREIGVYSAVSTPPAVYLIDGFSERAAGGEGIRADWPLAARMSPLFPVMLAGGLDAANVDAAIEAVGPLGVDVSSGVERDGEKDPALIETFVRTATSAFLRRSALASPQDRRSV